MAQIAFYVPCNNGYNHVFPIDSLSPIPPIGLSLANWALANLKQAKAYQVLHVGVCTHAAFWSPETTM